MKLGVKKLTPEAKLPIFATEQAACFDIYATDRTGAGSNAVIYSTGLAFDIPVGYCLHVYSRSGHGFNDGIRLANAVGIIDSDYVGEVKVKLTYDGPVAIRAKWPVAGDRIAQAKLVKLVKTELIEVEELKDTVRGEGGMGSTGNE